MANQFHASILLVVALCLSFGSNEGSAAIIVKRGGDLEAFKSDNKPVGIKHKRENEVGSTIELLKKYYGATPIEHQTKIGNGDRDAYNLMNLNTPAVIEHKGENEVGSTIELLKKYYGATPIKRQTKTEMDDQDTHKSRVSHMREKRGIKNWIRKLIGTEPTTTTAKPKAIVLGDSDIQLVIQMNRGKKTHPTKIKHHKKDDEVIEEDEKDNTSKKSTGKKDDADKPEKNSKKGKDSLSEPISLEDGEQFQVEVRSRKGRKKEKEEKIKPSSMEEEEVDSKASSSKASSTEEDENSKTAQSSEEGSEKVTRKR